MKKLLLIGMIFGALALTSCKKDYTCVCTIDGEDWPAEIYKNTKKKDAKDKCDKIGKLEMAKCSVD